ncbi:DUF927 domain-containing protein [Desulfovibrio sp. Huiquan2017]|uniref:DUF927 domain-containing protein n=1 Tax=Desulfovibrio sp. Huiquan2017 TaxID=2816861 RepID=UPI001A92D089|nr:DUF927 domain-containing protein [Desulfovibrio sp. Huiquan2017]
MIGHKHYATPSGMPRPLSRACGRANGMPLPVTLPVGIPPASVLSWCTRQRVESVSVFCKDEFGNLFGDYLVRIKGDSFERAVSGLFEYWAVLVNGFAVAEDQLTIFRCEDVLFLQVDARSFCSERGYGQLDLIYEGMNQRLQEASISTACSIEVVRSIDPFLRYLTLFDEEWRTKKDLLESLDPENDISHLFRDHNGAEINWIEYYTRHRPDPSERVSLLREVFLRARHAVERSKQAIPQHFGNLKRCALLQDVASTTVWEDEDELSLLGGVCNALNIRSFRRLCVCAGIFNPRMRKADLVSSWRAHDMPCRACAALASKFNYTCPEDCGVTTPLALPYMPPDAPGPSSVFFEDDRYVYHSVDGDRKFAERVCSSYDVVRALCDHRGDYWGYVVTPDKRATYYPLKIRGESKKSVLSSLEEIGVKVFNKNLAYQYALSTDSQGSIPTVVGTYHAGWSSLFDSPTYSFPYRQLSDVHPVPFLPEAGYKTKHGLSGTLGGWLDGLKGDPFIDWEHLALAVAFAGPLLRLVHCPSFVVHLWGGPPEARKHLLRLACSVWGSQYFAHSFASISDELGPIAAAHNDGLIAINFSESVSDTKARNLLKRLLGGSLLDAPYGSPLRHAIFSTGKKPVKVENGEWQIINLELPDPCCVPRRNTVQFRANYGHAGKRVVEHLLRVMGGDDLNAQVEYVKQGSVFARLKTIAEPCSRLLATIQIALGRGYQALGYPVGEAGAESFGRLWPLWLQGRTEVEREAILLVMDSIRTGAYPERLGDAAKCLTHVDYDGYRFTEGKMRGVLFPTKKFKELFCATVTPKRLAELLYVDGLLVKGEGGGFTSPRWIPGLRRALRGYFLRLPRRA